jgi:hypothetical protein
MILLGNLTDSASSEKNRIPKLGTYVLQQSEEVIGQAVENFQVLHVLGVIPGDLCAQGLDVLLQLLLDFVVVPLQRVQPRQLRAHEQTSAARIQN